MKITKFEYKTATRPNMSCGTGYSEPDTFQVECDDGSVHNITIDIWYQTEDSATQTFRNVVKRRFKNLTNLAEAFEMYKEALRDNKVCPYYWNK